MNTKQYAGRVVKNVQVNTMYGYPEFARAIVEFEDGDPLEFTVGAVFYDQYSSTPVLRINGNTRS